MYQESTPPTPSQSFRLLAPGRPSLPCAPGPPGRAGISRDPGPPPPASDSGSWPPRFCFPRGRQSLELGHPTCFSPLCKYCHFTNLPLPAVPLILSLASLGDSADSAPLSLPALPSPTLGRPLGTSGPPKDTAPLGPRGSPFSPQSEVGSDTDGRDAGVLPHPRGGRSPFWARGSVMVGLGSPVGAGMRLGPSGFVSFPKTEVPGAGRGWRDAKCRRTSQPTTPPTPPRTQLEVPHPPPPPLLHPPPPPRLLPHGREARERKMNA